MCFPFRPRKERHINQFYPHPFPTHREFQEKPGKLCEDLSWLAKCYTCRNLITRTGKPAANLWSTLLWTLCPPSLRRVFHRAWSYSEPSSTPVRVSRWRHCSFWCKIVFFFVCFLLSLISEMVQGECQCWWICSQDSPARRVVKMKICQWRRGSQFYEGKGGTQQRAPHVACHVQRSSFFHGYADAFSYDSNHDGPKAFLAAAWNILEITGRHQQNCCQFRCAFAHAGENLRLNPPRSKERLDQKSVGKNKFLSGILQGMNIFGGILGTFSYRRKNPRKNTQQISNQNLGAWRPKSTLQGPGLENFALGGSGGALKEWRRRRAEKWSSKTRNGRPYFSQ